MRPSVHPALPRLRRDEATVQLGLDSAKAVVVGGLPPAVATLVTGLDGRRTVENLRQEAAQRGADPATLDRALEVLGSAGVLVREHSRSGVRAAPDPPPPALVPDASALELADPQADRGAALVAARRAACVEVDGAGRVGVGVAVLLAASGVGRVAVADDRPVEPGDVAPGGVTGSDVGAPAGRAGSAAVRRAARLVDVAPPARHDPGQPPHLVVVAPRRGLGLAAGRKLLAAGIPHLLARVAEGVGTVGPLVVPGRTSCLRCQELHRAERDPSWPELARQAERAAAADTAAVALAATVAALAAQQALSWLDGFAPGTLDGTLEISPAEGVPRRRTWAPHPACGCGWR